MTDRSYLFVPGDRPERFDKALASGAHAVILDLEDAVTPARKPQARDALRAWLQSASSSVYVRVNPPGTIWHEDDCGLLSLPAVQGVMVPKAENPEALSRIAGLMPEPREIIPLVETVAGWFNLADLARTPRVQRLAFGSFDFMLDSGIQGEAQELDAVRSQIVLVSRNAGLQAPIDGVSLAIDDAAQLESDVLRSRRMGFGAKLCIHPKQVEVVHRIFSPTQDQIAWARRVMDALSAGPLGAVTVDGKLVDKPIALMAQSVLDEARTDSGAR